MHRAIESEGVVPIEKRMIGQQVRVFNTQEQIFEEGQVGDCAYLIEQGSVLIYLNKDGTEYPLKVLGKGEVFGEMSLIDNSLRSASCRTLEKTQLIVVTKDQLLDRIKTADPVVRLLMRALLHRLRFQNDNIRGKSIESEVKEHDEDRAAAVSQIELENRIAMALRNKEFVPWYQPIYDLVTLEIKGCEALMRWKLPDGLTAGPATFVDIMENSSLIVHAGHSMLEQATRDLYHLQDEMHPDFFVSVNVSGRQFEDPNFIEEIERLRQRYNVPAKKIKLEVTERVMMEGPQSLLALQSCRRLGYQLAIDDFGTGFSSLQYLASMPLDDLKIDRVFIADMLKSEKSMSIVKSLISMALLLGMNLIAEGIETEKQWQTLRQLGVRLGQGFLFCKPVPIEEFRLVAKRHPFAKSS